MENQITIEPPPPAPILESIVASCDSISINWTSVLPPYLLKLQYREENTPWTEISEYTLASNQDLSSNSYEIKNVNGIALSYKTPYYFQIYHEMCGINPSNILTAATQP